MNPKSKKTLKAAAVAAGLVGLLLPTGCSTPPNAVTNMPAPGAPHTVVVPHTVD